MQNRYREILTIMKKKLVGNDQADPVRCGLSAAAGAYYNPVFFWIILI
jgi:hypothetical protein